MKTDKHAPPADTGSQLPLFPETFGDHYPGKRKVCDLASPQLPTFPYLGVLVGVESLQKAPLLTGLLL